METILEANRVLDIVKTETNVDGLNATEKATYIKGNAKATSLIVQGVKDFQLEALREQRSAHGICGRAGHYKRDCRVNVARGRGTNNYRGRRQNEGTNSRPGERNQRHRRLRPDSRRRTTRGTYHGRYVQQSKVLKLSQSNYIRKLLNKFNMKDCKDCIDEKLQLSNLSCKVPTDKPFRQLIGSLMYLMLGTCPDICSALNYFRLEFKRGTEEGLVCYVDADWGSDQNDPLRHAELVVLCSSVGEGLWLEKLLVDLGVDAKRHIDLKFKFVCEILEKKHIKLSYIETAAQQADILTKDLQYGSFAKSNISSSGLAALASTHIKAEASVGLSLYAFASFRYYNQHICGATIIDEKHVLTASHCCFSKKELLPAKGITIVVGDLTLSKPTYYTVERKVEYVFTHPLYNQKDLSNDIAVLRVKKSFGDWNSMMKPINLATVLPESDTGCLVSGWGKLKSTDEYISDDLYKVIVPTMSNETCKTFYRGDLIKDGMFCAGFKFGQKDSCQGDSGGPLVCNNVLAGVVSWGVDCARAYRPGVYTDVAKYNEWIQEQIQRSSSRVTSTSSMIYIAAALVVLLLIQY
ncbi:hypothetical protein ILUMI_11287 [Ignelater luminosus]|uniref:Peptidase S1 domain-containing protein n=1 Tax=Ignelater luminosus TaxID=2038154 RepID=A0A8K0GE31_IGNLU|nr:hypothetical protein ILUMI_11287 [Ignelater luminosus]